MDAISTCLPLCQHSKLTTVLRFKNASGPQKVQHEKCKHPQPATRHDVEEESFQRHVLCELTPTLKLAESKLSDVSCALEQIDQQTTQINDQRIISQTKVQQLFQHLHQILDMQKAKIISHLEHLRNLKLQDLTAKKKELKTIQTQLVSLLVTAKENMRIRSQGEGVKSNKAVIWQTKEIMGNLKTDLLHPCGPVDVMDEDLISELAQTCKQYGEMYSNKVSPEKCYATGKGLEVAEPGERATAVLHIADHKGKACTRPTNARLRCKLVSDITSRKTKCSTKKIDDNQCEISFQPTSRGRHQLHIKVEGEHIKGSPFTVTVKLPVQKLGTPIKTITGVRGPWGVAVNQRGEVIVAESVGCCISMFSPTGEKLQSFGSQGSRRGQFSAPRGVAVDGDGNILVVDGKKHCIQKFTSDGNFITAVGKFGNSPLEFSNPIGIAIHPRNNKAAVSDYGNHRIQILNSDLSLLSTIGGQGSSTGHLCNPCDVAFDSAGHVYIADSGNHCVKVFTEEGEFLRQIGEEGKGNGDLSWPSGITVGSECVVYVTELQSNRVSAFTREGKYLTSFSTRGEQLTNHYAIATDKHEVVYVSDHTNNLIQLY